jgi:hypothetical protein
MLTTLGKQMGLVLANKTSPEAAAKAIQDDWAKFDAELKAGG